MTPEIVLGPPGCGKTTYLLGQVEAELARGVPPDRMGLVTFTRRAAEEAVSRACKRFGLDRDALPYFRTLHSLCFRALGLSRSDVLDGVRLRRDFADYVGLRITGRWTEEGALAGGELGDRLLFWENLARVRGIALRAQYEVDTDDLPWAELERTAAALAAFKAAEGLLDYTDMLAQFVAGGAAPRLEVLFVDEAQDLSWLQWRVVTRLAQHARRVVIAGDDDQAIYAWAGADAAHLVQMSGTVSVLGQSYRCPAAVQALGEAVISPVATRRPKAWSPRQAPGEVAQAMSFEDCATDENWADETDPVQPILVLARNDAVLRECVEPELRLRGVIYEREGELSVRPGLLRAIVAWEDLRRGDEVPAAEVRRAYELMTPDAGVPRAERSLPDWPEEEPATLAALLRRGLRTTAVWHEALDRIGEQEREYVVAALRAGERLRRPRPRVRISTIHGSKGGEARHVVLFKEMARRTHREMLRSTGDDERRVWYVAVTRARERLSVVGGRTALECPWL